MVSNQRKSLLLGIGAFLLLSLAGAVPTQAQQHVQRTSGARGDGIALFAARIKAVADEPGYALSRQCQQFNARLASVTPATSASVGNEPSASQAGLTRPVSPGKTEVPLRRLGRAFIVPPTINNAIQLPFIIDSGASEISIPANIVSALMQAGTISGADFLGKRTYRIADGSTLPSEVFRIRSLRVGNRVLENVVGSVAPVEGGMLLGQSFLSRFKSWSIDNQHQVLILE